MGPAALPPYVSVVLYIGDMETSGMWPLATGTHNQDKLVYLCAIYFISLIASGMLKVPCFLLKCPLRKGQVNQILLN